MQARKERGPPVAPVICRRLGRPGLDGVVAYLPREFAGLTDFVALSTAATAPPVLPKTSRGARPTGLQPRRNPTLVGIIRQPPDPCVRECAASLDQTFPNIRPETCTVRPPVPAPRLCSDLVALERDLAVFQPVLPQHLLQLVRYLWRDDEEPGPLRAGLFLVVAPVPSYLALGGGRRLGVL